MQRETQAARRLSTPGARAAMSNAMNCNFQYACFISYSHGQNDLVRGFMDQFTAIQWGTFPVFDDSWENICISFISFYPPSKGRIINSMLVDVT